MGNDKARAADLLGVGVAAPMREGAFGTTRWRVERWDEEQTRQAIARLKDLRIAIPGRVIGSHGSIAEYSDQVTPGLFRRAGIKPCRVSEFDGNLITNAGWTRLMSLLTNQSATQALDATHTRIGVGNSSTAEAYTDTDLGAAAGSANRWFQPVSGAGTLGTRTLAFSATFGTADGNFAWNEFGLDVTSATATAGNTVGVILFNHKAAIAQGTKASGQTWTATATLTFT